VQNSMRLYRGQRIAASFLHREQAQKQYLTVDRSLWYEPKLLDLGAGDGGITKKLSAFYSNVYVTEMSQARASGSLDLTEWWSHMLTFPQGYGSPAIMRLFKVMQWRLRNEGFHIEDVEKWSSSPRRYDMISALNLLDRHYNPRKLLRDLHSLALRSNCCVLLAVVLPIHQYVEFHPSRKTTEADVRLAVEGSTIEEQASYLVEREFSPAGFKLMRWTKLPYLCEGDYYKESSEQMNWRNPPMAVHHKNLNSNRIGFSSSNVYFPQSAKANCASVAAYWQRIEAPTALA
ncbi:DREV methyltransferase, partial [Teladorsagia circumcincta]